MTASTPGRNPHQAVTLSERNALARQCADLRDERDDLLRVIADLRLHVDIIDEDRRGLCDALETATGRDWMGEQARSWSS